MRKLKCREYSWQFWRGPHDFRRGLFGRVHACRRCGKPPADKYEAQAAPEPELRSWNVTAQLSVEMWYPEAAATEFIEVFRNKLNDEGVLVTVVDENQPSTAHTMEVRLDGGTTRINILGETPTTPQMYGEYQS